MTTKTESIVHFIRPLDSAAPDRSIGLHPLFPRWGLVLDINDSFVWAAVRHGPKRDGVQNEAQVMVPWSNVKYICTIEVPARKGDAPENDVLQAQDTEVEATSGTAGAGTATEDTGTAEETPSKPVPEAKSVRKRPGKTGGRAPGKKGG